MYDYISKALFKCSIFRHIYVLRRSLLPGEFKLMFHVHPLYVSFVNDIIYENMYAFVFIVV